MSGCYGCRKLLGTMERQIDNEIVPICFEKTIREAPSVKKGCDKREG